MTRGRATDEAAGSTYVSTGHLPPSEQVSALIDEAHARYKSNAEGKNPQVYPALAQAPAELFGICMVGTNGRVYAVGDAGYEFSNIHLPLH